MTTKTELRKLVYTKMAELQKHINLPTTQIEKFQIFLLYGRKTLY